MGRKFKLGSIRKKEERKRQTNKVNKVGRPPRIRKNEEREKDRLIKLAELLRIVVNLLIKWYVKCFNNIQLQPNKFMIMVNTDITGHCSVSPKPLFRISSVAMDRPSKELTQPSVRSHGRAQNLIQ